MSISQIICFKIFSPATAILWSVCVNSQNLKSLHASTAAWSKKEKIKKEVGLAGQGEKGILYGPCTECLRWV